MPSAEILSRLIGSALTLYMMLILLRWLAPWIELDIRRPALRWIPRVTDPLINALRRVLPPMGPMDWAPIAALAVVWLARLFLLQY